MSLPPRPVRAVLVLALLAPLAVSAQTFQREAAPFPVVADGEALPFPFTGGFFEPRPSLVDLNGDGVAELVVNVGGAGLQVYERVDGAWTWRTDRLGGIEAGTWSTFGDLDDDGDLDLLTRGMPGRVQFWRNVGPGPASPEGFPTFELAAEGLLASSGEPVYVEDSSIPALGDLDGDGDADLLSGKADVGTISYYRNEGVRDGLPVFTFVTDRFEDIVVYEENPSCTGPGGLSDTDAGAVGRGTARHGANAIALVDLTGDGLPELFWGDFFAPSLFYFVNVGTETEPEYRLEADRFPVGRPLTSGGYNAPTFGDADGDGDDDLVVGVQRGLCFQSQTAVGNLLYFENRGAPGDPDFHLQTNRLIESVDVGTRSAPALADVDGDGDLDLVVGNESNPSDPSRASLALYLNEGTDEAPAFRLADADWLGLAYDFGAYGPAFGDLDGDGDLDLLVGGFNGRFAFLRNTGGPGVPTFEREDDRFGGLDAGQYGRAALGDLDGDGDLDVVTGASSGRLRLYRNVGSATEPTFVTEPNGTPTADDLAYAQSVGLPDRVDADSAPALADLDGDGDLDLLVGTASGDLRVFRNVGTPTAPRFEEGVPIPGGRRRTAPAAGDLDGDGLPEILAGADAGGLLSWRSAGAATGSAPGLGERGSLHAVPNPSTGRVAFRAAGVDAGALVVLDARGRRVRELAVRGGAAEWDGRAADGADAAAGVYLARLQSDAGVETVPFTRLR